MLMLLVPLVLVDLSTDRASVIENRMLANPPKLTEIKIHPGKFKRDFDAWIKDSTGFREQILALYNLVNNNEKINGIWYINGQYTHLIGEQGHHYFADENSRLIPKFLGKQFVSNELLQNMATKLEEVKLYLDNKGIPLVVMLCTDKETIYPEFYPKSIKRGPEPIQLDVITKYLQDHTNVDVFNIRQALLAEKNDYLLYYLIDTMLFTSAFAHYNEIGAFFAYRELMKHINIHFPQIAPYELDDIEISYDEKEIPHISLKIGEKYKKLPPSFFDVLDLSDSTRFFNIAFENTEPDLPVILFLRDSYAEEMYIGKYFAQQFGRAIFTHFANVGRIEEFIDLYNPDIVVLESAERQLTWFANSVAEIPELP
jgi:hypothetical protein